MKKIIAFLLAALMIFSLCACGSKENKNSKPSDKNTVSFVKPKAYAAVIKVKINPEFNLYLNEEGKVMALEPINDDAKEIYDSVNYNNATVQVVVKNIITISESEGFIKKDANVFIELTEKKSSKLNTEDLVKKAIDIAGKTADNLDIKININPVVEKPKPENPKEDHTHSFAAATCTEPKKCSCGETEGKALGHSYSVGVCSRCSAVDPNYKFGEIDKKTGSWTSQYLVGEELYSTSIQFYGEPGVSVGVGALLSTLSPEMQELAKDECMLYKDNYYYIGKGDGGPIKDFKEDGRNITVTDENGNKLVLERIGEDTMKVTSSPDSFAVFEKVPVGSIYSFVE